MAEQMNIPSLRFGEFDGAWSKLTLESLNIDVIDGDRGVNYPNKDDLLPEGNCLFLSAKNVTKSGFQFLENQFITQDKDKLLRKGKLTRGDIVLTTRGSVGHKALYSDTVAFENLRINSGMVLLRNQWEALNNEFIYNSMFTRYFTKQIDVVSFGSAQPALTVKEIKKLKLSIPTTLPEQQKIASFLSKVDEKITLLAKKKEKLTEYKKGVMQQLFSGKWEERDGQLTFIPPTLRFKADDGSEFPDWEEKTLSDVLTIGNGRDYKHLSEGSVPVFGTGGYMTSVDEHLHDGETVFIGRKGTINKPYMFNGKFWTVDTLFYTKDFKGVLPTFVYSIFQRINWSIYNEATGVPSLSKSTIGKIKIDLPSIEEQTKITDFLSSLDKKIELTGSELDKSKEWKKGLLQQMFV